MNGNDRTTQRERLEPRAVGVSVAGALQNVEQVGEQRRIFVERFDGRLITLGLDLPVVGVPNELGVRRPAPRPTCVPAAAAASSLRVALLRWRDLGTSLTRL